MPYGEYIPFRRFFDGKNFGRLALIPRDMLSGTRTQPLDVGGISVADAICFDVAYDDGIQAQLRNRADLFVVAPATADFLGKVANGLADDLLSTLALAAVCPALFAPAMNADMWAKPAVQRNVARLREDGVLFVDPGSGWLSCGQVGPGRMAEPAEILLRIEQSFV